MNSWDLVNALRTAGLNDTQINSKTARAVVDVLMPDDGKLLIKEAKETVALMHKEVWNARCELEKIKQATEKAMAELQNVTTGVKEILAAEEQFKGEGDERTRNALLLYSAMLSIGGKSETSLNSAGYATYAYLGGQSAYLAAKEANKSNNQNDDEIAATNRRARW